MPPSHIILSGASNLLNLVIGYIHRGPSRIRGARHEAFRLPPPTYPSSAAVMSIVNAVIAPSTGITAPLK